jgi:phage-related protein
MGVVTFNGKSTKQLGLIVQFIPSYTFPEREYQTVNIPGRNGDLVLDKGSFRNTERTYSFAKIFQNGENFIEQANKIVAWLHSAKGYAVLKDTYEPDYYRLALYRSGGEMSNFYDVATLIDVTFECKPQRYLIEGDEPISITTNKQKIPSKTAYDANPIITFTVQANKTATITISGCSITVGEFDAKTVVTVDCENKECYSGTTLYNRKLKLLNNKFPVLPGNQEAVVEFENASNITIRPRWWTL